MVGASHGPGLHELMLWPLLLA